MCPVCGLLTKDQGAICQCCAANHKAYSSHPLNEQLRVILTLRYRWIRKGMPWLGKEISCPQNWDVDAQLKSENVGLFEAVMLGLCPACGFDLGFVHWAFDGAALEICPSCGIHFGVDDVSKIKDASAEETRQNAYERWRLSWIKAGMPWFSRRKAPLNWDPKKQLERVGGIPSE